MLRAIDDKFPPLCEGDPASEAPPPAASSWTISADTKAKSCVRSSASEGAKLFYPSTLTISTPWAGLRQTQALLLNSCRPNRRSRLPRHQPTLHNRRMRKLPGNSDEAEVRPMTNRSGRHEDLRADQSSLTIRICSRGQRLCGGRAKPCPNCSIFGECIAETSDVALLIACCCPQMVLK